MILLLWCGTIIIIIIIIIMGGDLAPSLGGLKKILCTKFWNDLFLGKNFNFNTQNFGWLFLVIDSILSVFCLSLLSHIWYITTYMTMWPLYDPFLGQKPLFQNKQFLLETFFSQFVLCLTSNNNTSRNIGGTDASSPQII